MSPTETRVVTPAESPDGYAHVTLPADSLFIRFYLWLYFAEANSINTCKLFWAYVFAPIAIVFRVIFAGLRAVNDRLPDRSPRPPKPPREGPSKPEQILDSTATKLGGLYARFATALRWAGIIIGGAGAIVLTVLLVSWAITQTAQFLVFLAVVAGAALLIAALFTFIMWVEHKQEQDGKVPFFSTMGRLASGFHRHTCAKIELDKK